MTFFEFLKFFFNNPTEAMELDKTEIERHSFMLNRIMAIKYPEHAEHLSTFGLSAFAVVGFWSEVAKRYNTYPKFLYIKQDKAPDLKEMNEFLEYMKVDSFTKNYLMKNPEKIEQDVQQFNEMNKIEKTK